MIPFVPWREYMLGVGLALGVLTDGRGCGPGADAGQVKFFSRFPSQNKSRDNGCSNAKRSRQAVSTRSLAFLMPPKKKGKKAEDDDYWSISPPPPFNPCTTSDLSTGRKLGHQLLITIASPSLMRTMMKVPPTRPDLSRPSPLWA